MKVVRIGAWPAIVSILLLSLPIPLGYKRVDKKDGIPFPCQNRPCGCSSAEQCWTSCRCFTTTEKIAWAENKGVEIPGFAVLDGFEGVADTSLSINPQKASAKSCCCCSSKKPELPEIQLPVLTDTTKNCCSSVNKSSTCSSFLKSKNESGTDSLSENCCSEECSQLAVIQDSAQLKVVNGISVDENVPNRKPSIEDRLTNDASEKENPASSKRDRWIFSIEAQKCRGAQAEYLFAVVQVIIPVESLVGEHEFKEYLACSHEMVPGSLRQPPDLPPPKSVGAI